MRAGRAGEREDVATGLASDCMVGGGFDAKCCTGRVGARWGEYPGWQRWNCGNVCASCASPQVRARRAAGKRSNRISPVPRVPRSFPRARCPLPCPSPGATWRPPTCPNQIVLQTHSTILSGLGSLSHRFPRARCRPRCPSRGATWLRPTCAPCWRRSRASGRRRAGSTATGTPHRWPRC